MTTPTPPKVKTLEEILAVLDENVHYDPAELGCNWDLEDAKTYLRTAILEVLKGVRGQLKPYVIQEDKPVTYLVIEMEKWQQLLDNISLIKGK